MEECLGDGVQLVMQPTVKVTRDVITNGLACTADGERCGRWQFFVLTGSSDVFVAHWREHSQRWGQPIRAPRPLGQPSTYADLAQYARRYVTLGQVS